MPQLFESYDDLEDIGERLKSGDPAERRVAIIELGNSGDADAVAHLDAMVTDVDTGVRQQVALALGEFDGPEVATSAREAFGRRRFSRSRPRRPTALPN